MISTAAHYARDLDRMPGDQVSPVEPIDVAPILGGWSNTNRSSWGITYAELIRRDDGDGGDGQLEVHVIAADPPGEPHDWGRATVERLFADGPGSSQVSGFTATFNFAHARTHLQANVIPGLTVFATFTTFTDGSGRASYFSREFFCRLARPAPAAAAPLVSGATPPAAARGEDRLPMLHATIDPTLLLGRWRNVDEATRGVAEIGCELRDDQLFVRVVAVGPEGAIDWGEATAALHTDLCATGGGRAAAAAVIDGRPTPHYADTSVTEAGPAFWAVFDHGFERVHLQARSNLGVLVVAMFTEFTDGSGRANYFHRELFMRAG